MQRTNWRGIWIRTTKKSRPSTIFPRSVVTKLFILPIKLPDVGPFVPEETTVADEAEIDFVLALLEVDLIELACNVSSPCVELEDIASSPSLGDSDLELSPVLLLEDVDGVVLPEPEPEMGVSAFTRIRSECSNTS